MIVKVYSTPTCHTCNGLKAWLKQNKIEFESIDIVKDKKAAEDMVEKSGQMSVPVTEIDGKIVSGFDVKKLKEALKIE
jgi:glutaredoxin 3